MRQLFGHLATTEGVTVMVAVDFQDEQSPPNSALWYWTYHVRIENSSGQPLRLVAGHWRAVDSRGAVTRASCVEFAGTQPQIGDGESFDFVAACSLQTSRGAIDGHVVLEREDGSELHAMVPNFPLVVVRKPA